MQSLQSVFSFCCPISSSVLDTSFLFASTNIGLNIYKPWWQVFLPKPNAKAQESETSSFVLVEFGLFVSLFLNLLYLAHVVPSSCSVNNCWMSEWISELHLFVPWYSNGYTIYGAQCKMKITPPCSKSKKNCDIKDTKI